MRVLTIGTFDMLHMGHVNLLRRAAGYGNDLYVGVNSDRFVEDYKGRPPVMSQEERLAVVSAIKGVTWAEINDGPGRELIERIHPAVIAIGSDWHGRDYLSQIDVKRSWLEQNKVAIVYLPYTQAISTTLVRERLER